MNSRLKDYCILKGGTGFPELFQGKKEGDFPFIKVSDMSLTGNEKYITVANNYINKTIASSIGATIFPANSIVFAKVGAALLLNRRRILTTSTIIDNNMMAAIPTKVNTEFLYYFLSSLDFADFVQTGALPSINQSVLDNIQFPIFKPSEQQYIAKILSTIDQTIAHTEALIHKYQQIKAGLMHDLFTRGITSDGQLRPPRKQAPELYKDSAIGWIPKEWTAQKLGEIVQFQRGHDIVESNFEKGTYPVVSSSGVIGYHSKCTTKAPNIVIGRKGTIGKVHFLDVDFWAHDTSLYAINLYKNEPLFIYYLCIYLNLARFGTKSGSPSLNRNDIHPLEIACPSPDEQKMISSRLISVDKKIEIINQDSEKLTKQKSGLMQDLLTGKVPVTISES